MAGDVLEDIASFLKEMENSTADVTHRHDHHAHHDAHDHSMHTGHSGHGDHGGHMMKMWFHGGWDEVILFDFWRIDSLAGLILSFICIFVMGAMYEGIKWFRVYLQMNASSNSLVSRGNGVSLQKIQQDKAPLHNEDGRCSSGDDVYNPTTTPPAITRSHQNRRSNSSSSASPFSPMRLVQAFLYVVQLVLAYWLMLIVMTYNTWLTCAVVLGAGFGHWLFAVLKFRDPLGESADSFATDACH
ncbi:unnamed protein product [Nippostrongylus brasiliensis]|uniref:Copper transport protein n=1 Tax=Nippostrongylus brasiliensis TaxID=27835 RepID=A0A0N4Y541_NIPBR|nr:hypothetical protein Q1695_010319 [Nippostrongylus brasiliensis]VDL74666.1 unnamed protein product [Nippostrongylus brasiliensis]